MTCVMHIYFVVDRSVCDSRASTTQIQSIQTSTAEMLECFGEYLRRRCWRDGQLFDPSNATLWLCSVDRALLRQGWQDITFLDPASIVFVYLLVSAELDAEVSLLDVYDGGNLHALVLSCLYTAYSYMGHETSYALKPFLLSSSSATKVQLAAERKAFWRRCLCIVGRSSSNMLRLNTDPTYFGHVFAQLKLYSPSDLRNK